MKDALIEAEVSLTPEDYYECNYVIVKSRLGGNFLLFYLIAGILIMLALIFPFILNGFWLISPVFILFAVYFILQPVWLFPRRIRKETYKSYEQNPVTGHPTKVYFTEEQIIETPVTGQKPPYIEVNWPYHMVYEAIETQTHFIIQFDMQLGLILRKDTLSQSQRELLISLLQRKMGARFHKL